MLTGAWLAVRSWWAKWWPVVGAFFTLGAAAAWALHRARVSAEQESARRDQERQERERAATERQLADAMRTALAQRAEAQARRAAEHEGRADQAAEHGEWARKRVEALSDADVVREFRQISIEKRARKSRVVGPLMVIGALVLGSPSAAAQSEPVDLVNPATGEHGLWLDFGLAREVMADVRALEDAKREIAELRASLEMERGQARSLRESVDLAQATARASASDAVRAMAETERVKQRMTAWWRRPGFLIGVGFAVGAGCVTALVLGVH